MTRVRLVINGRVQGVNFRSHARERAERAGVTGWIRNRDDGAVEIVAEGEDGAVASFARWCERGPRLARVDGIETEALSGARRYTEFSVTERALE